MVKWFSGYVVAFWRMAVSGRQKEKLMYNLFGELEEKLDFLGLKRRYNEDTMICYSRIHQHMTTAVQYPWLEP